MFGNTENLHCWSRLRKQRWILKSKLHLEISIIYDIGLAFTFVLDAVKVSNEVRTRSRILQSVIR